MDSTDSDTGSVPAGKKSFWETLPGLLTGLAAVLSAIAGLITVLCNRSTIPPITVQQRVAEPSPQIPARHHAARSASNPVSSPERLLNVSGLWHDVNLGTEVRVRQSGRELFSETFDPASGRRLAIGQGRIFGRLLEGTFVWMNGARYSASLRVSEDGQEINGTTRNLLTGEIGTSHLTR